MTAIAYRPKLGSELEYVGRLADVGTRRVEVVQFEAWYEDTYTPEGPVLIGKNGRPRNRITLPGHGAGVSPPNKGKTLVSACAPSSRRQPAFSGAFSIRAESAAAFKFRCRSHRQGRGMPAHAKPTEPRPCAHCGTEFTPSRPERAAVQRFCSRSCGVTAAHARNRSTTTPWQERFWGFVPEPRPDGCWEWQGSRNRQGYGILMVSKHPYRTVGAHRASSEIHNGPIPDGLWVLHRCDNPPCVNPAHLFVGTPADNVEDMMQKGRWGGVEGEASNLARFPREVVDEVLRLKASTALSNRVIGERVGMSKAHVRRIVIGEARRRA